jgi:hypothetical protein
MQIARVQVLTMPPTQIAPKPLWDDSVIELSLQPARHALDPEVGRRIFIAAAQKQMAVIHSRFRAIISLVCSPAAASLL